MAELEAAIKSRLGAYGGLTALVASRVYPLQLPQRPTLPAVTYRRIDGPREHAMGADPGLAHPRIQVDSWGASYADTKAVATQVRGALQRWRGIAAGVEVLAVYLQGDEDGYEPETKQWRVRQDWIVWHRE